MEAYPAVVYLDRHGNALVHDMSPSCRRRVSAGADELQRRQRDLDTRLARLWEEATQARRRKRSVQELVQVRAVLDQGVGGYLVVELARRRFQELERDRRRRFLEILAGEGIRPGNRIDGDLKSLEQLSRGLPVERLIARERARLRSGVIVERRRQG